MPRRAPLIVGLLLALVAAFVGLRLGWQVARLDEGAVILAVADHCVAEAGGSARREDCAAIPGQVRGVWLVVICGSDPQQRFDVDRAGRFRAQSAAPPEV